MIEKIQDHYNDAEIIQLEIEPDMTRWEHILEFNEKEIEFLSNLLSTERSEKSRLLRQQMETVKERNTQHQKTFLDFKNILENQRECDELDCDVHYLKQYFVLKEILLKHFQALRDDKNKIYTYFNEVSEK